MNLEKLAERCSILEDLIISTAEIYNNESTSIDQKALLETIIGAAIWYLPSGEMLWTRMISKNALEHIKQGRPKSQLTKEHKYPRKQAGKQLLTEKYKELVNQKVKLIDLYLNEYGKFNYVLKSENKQLVQYQKDAKFIDSETAYSAAKIDLIEISTEDITRIKNNSNNQPLTTSI